MERTETPTLSLDVIYTPDEVAAILSCSRTHVYRLMKTGYLEYSDISAPGSKVTKARVSGSALQAYLSLVTVAAPQ